MVEHDMLESNIKHFKTALKVVIVVCDGTTMTLTDRFPSMKLSIDILRRQLDGGQQDTFILNTVVQL